MPVSVPNDFVAGTLILSDNVDANFQALVSYINNNVVLKDGSVAFTGAPSYASDPSGDNDLIRKGYADKSNGYCLATRSGTQTSDGTLNLGTLHSFTASLNYPSGLFTVSDDKLIVNVNCVALVGGTMGWGSHGSGTRKATLLRNTAILKGDSKLGAGSESGGAGTTINLTTMAQFTAGQYLNMETVQNSGATLSFSAEMWVAIVRLL